MKKLKEKKVTTFLIGMILGIVVAGTSAYAAIIYQSSQVSYSNSTSGLSSTNVQGAIDELSNIYENWINPMSMGKPKYFIRNGTNEPTRSDPTTPPSGETTYLGLYDDGQIGVCIKDGSDQYCFRTANWVAEHMHMQIVFQCTYNSNSASEWYECNKNNIYCEIDPKYVECDDLTTGKYCIWYSANNGGCYD